MSKKPSSGLFWWVYTGVCHRLYVDYPDKFSDGLLDNEAAKEVGYIFPQKDKTTGKNRWICTRLRDGQFWSPDGCKNFHEAKRTLIRWLLMD
jgi:hypothetical protein